MDTEWSLYPPLVPIGLPSNHIQLGTVSERKNTLSAPLETQVGPHKPLKRGVEGAEGKHLFDSDAMQLP